MSHVQQLIRARGLALALGPAACLTLSAGTVSAQPIEGSPLAGTSWQLVRFAGGDGSVLTPDDRAKYTLAFDVKGSVAVRVDCNRGRGTWKSSAANQVQFGPLALTRAMCPPGSLHDQIVKQWGNVRSYVLKDGHLFLSLMADGGIYEFEPAAGSFRSSVRPAGPAAWTCVPAGGKSDSLRVTFYATEPPLVLLERGGVTRPAFRAKSASGARYEGDDVLFWEGRGEATLNWMGVKSICKPVSGTISASPAFNESTDRRIPPETAWLHRWSHGISWPPPPAVTGGEGASRG